jgi:nicotinate-nucleotide--dimethylbenzimidazole phosphoribosyltransferase
VASGADRVEPAGGRAARDRGAGAAAGAEERVGRLAALVPALDRAAEAAASERQARLLKPPGSLGRLEALGIRLAAMAGRCPPPLPGRPVVLVAAGDHGVVAQGVTPWPQAVTGAMVAAMTSGQAAVNAIAGAIGAEVRLLDVGVASEPAPHPLVRQGNVRRGTADLAAGPAMTREQAALAVLEGAAAAAELLDAGADLLVTGDMGIGNTTAAACLIAAFTGREPAAVTGRGSGIDDATLHTKVEVVERALGRHAADPADPLGVLAAVGGLEHGALAGLALAGAARRVPVLLDGVNAGAAALVAAAIEPKVAGFLIAGHRSVEPGAGAAIEHLGLEPLLDLRMRLGEGTGALLAVPVVRAAAAVLGGMATFEEAGLEG